MSRYQQTNKVVTKKAKPNGFAMFMQDIRDRYREEGQRVPSMAEMVNIANPLWSNLSQQDKSYFNQRAKVASKSGISMAKVVADTRLDCVGEPIAERVDEKGQLEERRKSERHFTRARFGVGKSAAKCRFFFIDFQFLCKVEKGNYIPCEVAAIEYSIECGIIRTWHKFIDPGRIPTGYRYEAQNRSEQVHNIPVDKFEHTESDYALILEELQQFINPQRENEFPPIFARKEESEMVESCCRWLAERTDTDHELFKVYVLEYLLIDLSGHVSDISPSPHEAKDMLSSSAFDYEPGTNCAWHEEREIRHCSQGMVNRHAYIFSDHLCPKYNISMGPTHLPLVKESQQHTVLSPCPQDSDVMFPSRDIRYFPSQQQSKPFQSYKYEVEDNESLASFVTDTTSISYPQQSVKPISSPKPGAKIGRGRARNKVPTISGNHNAPVIGSASSTFGTVGDTLRDCDSEISEIMGTEVAFNALNLGSSADTAVKQHLTTTTATPEPPIPSYAPTPQSYLSDNYYTAYPLPSSTRLPTPSPSYLSEPAAAAPQYQQHVYSPPPPNPATVTPYNHSATTPYNPTTATPYNPTTATPYNPATATSYNPTTATPYNHTTATPYNPATATSYNPTTATPYNPTTTTPYNPATATSYNPTTATSYNPTTATPYTPSTALNNAMPTSTTTTLANPSVNHYQQQLPQNNHQPSVPTMIQPPIPSHPTQPQTQPQYNSFAVSSAPPQPTPYQYPQYQAPPAPQLTYSYPQQATYDQFNNYNPNIFRHPQQTQAQFPAAAASYSFPQRATQPVFQPPQQSYPPTPAPLQPPLPAQIPPNYSYLQNYGAHPPNPQTIAQYPRTHAPQAHSNQMDPHAPKPNPSPQNGFYHIPQQIPRQGEPTYSPPSS